MGLEVSGINLDVGGVFKGIIDIVREVRMAITGEIDPAKKAELDSKLIEIEAAALNAQNAVNLEEAKNPNVFVSGWRPFVGWVAGFAYAYNYIFMPLLVWSVKSFGTAYGFSVPDMPSLDMGELTTLLFGMLGLGAMRSYEKIKGVAK